MTRGGTKQGSAGRSAGSGSPKPTRKPKPKKSGLGRVDDGMLFVFGHPLRIRIIAELNEKIGSPSELAKRLGVKTYHTDYHIKQLKQHDCVEVVERLRVRGCQKTIYRAKVKLDFPEEIWESLPPSVQKLVIAALFLTSANDAQEALVSGAFEKRPESHASWTSLKLDEQGWQLLVPKLDIVLREAEQIQADAKERLEANMAPPLRVSLNLSSFVLPDNTDPQRSDRFAPKTVREKLRRRTQLKHQVDESEK